MDKIKFQEMQNTKDRLLRIKQIIPHYLPISKASFWAGVKSGRYPKPLKLSERTTCWRESEILAIIRQGAAGNE